MWKYKCLFLMVLVYIPSGHTQNKSNSQSSYERVLTNYAGSYELDGDPQKCPEGEFGYARGGFVVGSDLRITNINRPRSTQLVDRVSRCKLYTQSNFRNNQLKYTFYEACQNRPEIVKEYVFDFAATANEKKIELNISVKNKSIKVVNKAKSANKSKKQNKAQVATVDSIKCEYTQSLAN